MGSSRQLVNRESKIDFIPIQSALIYGGIRYDMDSAAILHANRDISASPTDTTGGLFAYANRGNMSNDTFQYLPGTEKEARYLYNLLLGLNFKVTMRLGYAGSEESFKQMDQNGPSPSLLHIGTHGFFYPDPNDTTRRRANQDSGAPIFKISDHALIRSGLILAGANYAWGKKHPMQGMEDGILTAHEVSHMNLSNTQLVVLSACETGLGDIKGNEGVYGLQRAFRIAGAKNVLMSLWKVPDDATGQLMTRFYSNWLKQKKPLRESFEEAQQWLRGISGYENPYFWAGFVLIGEQ
jgi:CHAT domain-containing protein